MSKNMISERLFNQIKLVHKLLVKASNIDPDGVDLSAMPTEKLEEQVEDTLPDDDEPLSAFMNHLPDFLCASNLKIHAGYSETVAFTSDQSALDGDPLNYSELEKRTAEMIGLGRTGIEHLNKRNRHFANEISDLRTKMNVIA